MGRGAKVLYERGDSNPHVLRTLDPKSSASTNSATLAEAPIILNELPGFRPMTISRVMIKTLFPGTLMLAMLLSSCTPPRVVLTVSERPQMTSTENPQTNIGMRVDPERYPTAPVDRFDDGRMWTFEAIPFAWWEEAYAFSPDERWLERARRGALQFGQFCSASLVSHRGLVMTNHHCARESVLKVSAEGEALLDNGFYAASSVQERRIPGLSLRQLIEMEDVSDEVNRAARDVKGWGPQADARRKRSEAIERRLAMRHQGSRDSLTFVVVEQVPGVRYSAHTYRVFDDVRLVWVPDLSVGHFGGDADNFEWPRHTLDAAFFRIWDNGEPLRTADHFLLDPSGAETGEPVFVVGNPGSTQRLVTVSQLEYDRDVELPEALGVLRHRISLMEAFVDEAPAAADSFNVGADLMAARNQLKGQSGQHAALLDGVVLSKAQAWEDSIRSVLSRDATLSERFGRPFQDIALIQQSKEVSAPKARSFTHFMHPHVSSRILMRAMYGYVYALSARRGAPPDVLDEIRKEAMAIKDWPRALEAYIIAARLMDFERALGSDDPTVRRMLGDKLAVEVADSVAAYSALADSAAFAALLSDNYLASKDPTVDLINTIGALYFTLDGQLQALSEREDALVARLAALRYEVQGDATPPDAAFTLRISDGRIVGYEADDVDYPAFTTFGSMFAMSDSLKGQDDWELSATWRASQYQLDTAVPLNLVATTDIAGGNSGSPMLDGTLRIVGLVFDSNRYGLANEYAFSDTLARTIAVDVRALIETLETVVDADRLVLEMLEGNYFPDEMSAEKAR